VSAWYTEMPASGAALRDDIAKLAAYHRNADALRQTEAAYAADLARDEAGKVQWVDTSAALRAVEELGAWGATHDALSRQDRKAIGERTEALRRAHAAYQDYAAVVARDFVTIDVMSRTP